MNLWTDIALANLQRTRPAPEDDEERFVCKECGHEKPESAYRCQYGLRDKMCKHCRAARERSLRAEKGKQPQRRSRLSIYTVMDSVLAALSVRQMTMTQLLEQMECHRRTAERAVAWLRDGQRIAVVSHTTVGTNNRVPVYGLINAGHAPAERITA